MLTMLSNIGTTNFKPINRNCIINAMRIWKSRSLRRLGQYRFEIHTQLTYSDTVCSNRVDAISGIMVTVAHF